METYEKNFIDSTNVRRIKYHPVGKILEVQFLNGKIYHYYEVPENIWQAAFVAPSIGRFIQERIKGVYTYEALN